MQLPKESLDNYVIALGFIHTCNDNAELQRKLYKWLFKVANGALSTMEDYEEAAGAVAMLTIISAAIDIGADRHKIYERFVNLLQSKGKYTDDELADFLEAAEKVKGEVRRGN